MDATGDVMNSLAMNNAVVLSCCHCWLCLSLATVSSDEIFLRADEEDKKRAADLVRILVQDETLCV
jgi:hypothetical protein